MCNKTTAILNNSSVVKLLLFFSANRYPAAAGNRLQGSEKSLAALMYFPKVSTDIIL
jgi:hypothetical protein